LLEKYNVLGNMMRLLPVGKTKTSSFPFFLFSLLLLLLLRSLLRWRGSSAGWLLLRLLQ